MALAITVLGDGKLTRYNVVTDSPKSYAIRRNGEIAQVLRPGVVLVQTTREWYALTKQAVEDFLATKTGQLTIATVPPESDPHTYSFWARVTSVNYSGVLENAIIGSWKLVQETEIEIKYVPEF
jgi:hypothetical protein